MIFIPSHNRVAFLTDPHLDQDNFVFLLAGDICIVMEYRDAEGQITSKDQRSLILHPKHGPCWTFVAQDRGRIVDV
jgi:hypothetical protein